MSIGNLKDQGNKGNNFPYQLKTLQLLGAINDSISALPGVDYETRTTTYQATCTICGPGYSTSDIIVRYDIIDVALNIISYCMVQSNFTNYNNTCSITWRFDSNICS